MNCSHTPVRLPRLARACAFSWLFAFITLSWAAAQGTLTGTVTNAATGATLEGARIVLAGSNRETTTDNLGTYRFDDVPAGETTLSVSYTGLTTQEAKVTVAPAGPTRRDVGLTSDLYLMSRLVVASEREGNAKAITLQRQSEGVRAIVSADAFGGLAGNPADLAIRLPGVEGESVGGDMRYVRIRGLHQNLSSIAQDGNRLADAGSAGATREFQFQTVGSDSVERIEVIKSPTPDFDADSIGGVVNLISKSAFDSSGERRFRGSFGAIWRPSDPRDSSRPNGSLSYSEVFGGKLGINLNLAYRPHGSIIDMSTQGFQQLPVGVEGPAYQYQLSVQDFRNVRTRSGAGLRVDYKLSDQVRFFVNFQLNKHIEHSDHTQATWGLTTAAQAVATVDANGNLTGPGAIVPGYTDYETRVRALPGSSIAIYSQSAYKLGKTKTLNLAGIHRYPGFDLDYDVYGSKSKSDYPGNNTFTFTLPGAGWTIRRDDALFPTVTQTAGPDWTRLESYTTNAYTSAKMVGWDSYLGSSVSAKKQFQTRWPSFVKAGLRWREQTRNLDNTPFNYTYVGPDGVMGPNAANGGRNDDNLAQFGQANRPFPDTSIGKYGSLPFPAFQALGRPDDLEGDIAANPSYWRRPVSSFVASGVASGVASDLQAALVNNQQFTEEIRAAYVMGNMRIGKLNVLTGVRIERTMTEGTGALQVLTPEEKARRAAWGNVAVTYAEAERRAYEEFHRRVTREGDYQGVFPGLHLKYQFKRNWLMRFSYSEAIGRPGIGQLIPRTTVNLDTSTLTTSNPSLEPQWSKNWDIATEYYFEPAGAVSVGVFQKDLTKFIYTTGGQVVGSGQDNGFGGEYAGFTVTTQYNGGRAKVKGLELSYTQQYTFLPGIWKGLGAFANATWMNAEGNYGSGTAIALAPNPRIAGFNPFIANAGISYIRSKLNLRATFNYRHKYLSGFNANESRAVYFAARPTLDLKALYNINRRIAVYVDVANVLEQEDRETQFGFGRPQTTHRMLRQFFFGVNLRN